MKKVNIKARKLIGLEKFIGLMGKDKPETVCLETRWGIHTFFMKYPIDVFVLDDKNKVVKVKRNLKPWRVFFWNPRYYKILEMESDNRMKNYDTISLFLE